MAQDDDRAKLRSYLAAQSAKLSAPEIGARLEEAAGEFLAALGGVSEGTAHARPADGEWSLAEVVDHVRLTLDEVAGIIRTLAGGALPARAMTIAAQPVNAARPLAELVERLTLSQAAVAEFLRSHGAEPHTDLRLPDNDFGEINWKGYALILRLHYKDHAQQVRKTLEALASGRS
ncbi:MAG: DinB family protein [Candidatus Rokubacteria bacterium]|nr:DinB family protein [Candidatus Rokubacteria bacterium]